MNRKGTKLVTVVALSSLVLSLVLYGSANLTERTGTCRSTSSPNHTRLLYVKQGTDNGSSESDEESQGKQKKLLIKVWHLNGKRLMGAVIALEPSLEEHSIKLQVINARTMVRE
ncbi:MAG: hypothetical protein ACLT90_16880 [Enterococcus raffinosus]